MASTQAAISPPVERFGGEADGVDVALQHAGHHVLIAEAVVRGLNALHRGEARAHHFLQGSLHARIAVEAKLDGEADDRGLGDRDGFAELAGRHEGGLVVGFENVVCDALFVLWRTYVAGPECGPEYRLTWQVPQSIKIESILQEALKIASIFWKNHE